MVDAWHAGSGIVHDLALMPDAASSHAIPDHAEPAWHPPFPL